MFRAIKSWLNGKWAKAPTKPAFWRPSLQVECLERRDLLSAGIPGFTLSGGNLYNGQVQIDSGVQSFTLVNGKVYDLHTNVLESMNTDGSGKVILDTNVVKFVTDQAGNALTLDAGGNLDVNGVFSASAQGLYQSPDVSGNAVAYMFKGGVLYQYSAGSWVYEGGTSEVVQGCGQLLCTTGSGANLAVWTPTGVPSGNASFEFLSLNIQDLYQGYDQSGNPLAYLYKGGILYQYTGANFADWTLEGPGYHQTTDNCWAYEGTTATVAEGCGQILSTTGSGTNLWVCVQTGLVSGVASFEFVASNVQGLYQGYDQSGNPVAYIYQGGVLKQYTGVNFADWTLEGPGYHQTTDNCWAYERTTATVAQGCGQILSTSGSGGSLWVCVQTGVVSGVASFEFVASNVQGLYQAYDQSGNPVAYIYQDGVLKQYTGVNFADWTVEGPGYHQTTDNCWAYEGTSVNQAPAFTSASATTFSATVQGSFPVTASGSPAPTLSENPNDVLPSGVTFTASTGLLAGKPAAGSGGTYTLHFTAHNGVGTDATQTFTLTVNNTVPPAFTSAAGYVFTVNAPGTFTVSASGVPAPTLSENANDVLPTNVSFNAATGILSGTPALGSAGTYTLHFTAGNGVGSPVPQTFILTITEATQLVVTTGPQTLTAATPSGAISVQLQDGQGRVAQAPAGGVVVTLSSNSSGGSFLDTNGNALAGSSITIPAGASSASFKYLDSQTGAATIVVSSAGLSGASQQEAVDPAGLSFPVAVTNISATAATPFSGTVATFTVADTTLTASSFRASIDWGDGHVSKGTVSGGSGSFTVTGGNTYAQEGRYQVAVGVDDSQGDTAGGFGLAHVARTGPEPGTLAAVAVGFTHSIEYFSNLVTTKYQSYLGRAPDAAGLGYWIRRLQNNLTDEQLEASFIGSSEFIQDHGGLNASWITSMYQILLGRNPDTSGLNYWLSVVQSGANPFAIALGFAASPERESQRISADYQTYLGRTADAGGLAYWLGQFESGARNEDVVAGFVSSAEYFQTHHDNIGDWLYRAYQDVLGRAPDNGGYQYWEGALEAG
jgi:hypothetical protein